MTEETLDIVNETDEVIGQATRAQSYANKHPHRIVHVMVFDNLGKMALQKSSLIKPFLPGYWGTTAGGHVRSGETPEIAAKRELKEELGIDANIELVGKTTYHTEQGLLKFISIFKTNYEGEFVCEPEEVDYVKYFSPDELRLLIDHEKNIYPELLFLLKKYYL